MSSQEYSAKKRILGVFMQISEHTYCDAIMSYASGPDGTEARQMSLRDGRQTDALSWEENGFELLGHESSVHDWTDEEAIKRFYYPEMESLAKSLSDSDVALISSHILRNPESARKQADYAPIQFVHSDFTENYGDLLKSRYEDPEEGALEALERAGLSGTDVRNSKRLLILQFWRNVGPSIMDLPIAFCDAQTVPREDMFSIHVPNYANEGKPFDAFGLRWHDKADHHWYTFPQMTVDEVVAFRTFDSACLEFEQPFWTPHSAFSDPTHPDAPARHSIEVRAMCLYMS